MPQLRGPRRVLVCGGASTRGVRTKCTSQLMMAWQLLWAPDVWHLREVLRGLLVEEQAKEGGVAMVEEDNEEEDRRRRSSVASSGGTSTGT